MAWWRSTGRENDDWHGSAVVGVLVVHFERLYKIFARPEGGERVSCILSVLMPDDLEGRVNEGGNGEKEVKR